MPSFCRDALLKCFPASFEDDEHLSARLRFEANVCVSDMVFAEIFIERYECFNHKVSSRKRQEERSHSIFSHSGICSTSHTYRYRVERDAEQKRSELCARYLVRYPIPLRIEIFGKPVSAGGRDCLYRRDDVAEGQAISLKICPLLS